MQAVEAKWSLPVLADVLGAEVSDVEHALWVLAANEDSVAENGPEGHWGRIGLALREDANASSALNQTDLIALREQLSSMKIAPPENKHSSAEPHAVPGAVGMGHSARQVTNPTGDADAFVIEWEGVEGTALVYRCAPSATYGEANLARALGSLEDALVILNPSVVQGRSEREVDAIILTPRGVVTIEQKDVGETGVLSIPLNGTPTLDGRPLKGLADARQQARKHAQVLASAAKREPAIDIGFIHSILSIEGSIELASSPRGNVVVTRTADIIAAIDSALTTGHRITTRAIRALLLRLELPQVPAGRLVPLGFLGPGDD